MYAILAYLIRLESHVWCKINWMSSSARIADGTVSRASILCLRMWFKFVMQWIVNWQCTLVHSQQLLQMRLTCFAVRRLRSMLWHARFEGFSWCIIRTIWRCSHSCNNASEKNINLAAIHNGTKYTHRNPKRKHPGYLHFLHDICLWAHNIGLIKKLLDLFVFIQLMVQFRILINILPSTLLSVWMRWVDPVCYRVHLSVHARITHSILTQADILKCLLIVEDVHGVSHSPSVCQSACLLPSLILMKSIYAGTCSSILQSNIITFVFVNVFASYWMRSDVIMLLPLHVQLLFKFVDL